MTGKEAVDLIDRVGAFGAIIDAGGMRTEISSAKFLPSIKLKFSAVEINAFYCALQLVDGVLVFRGIEA
jgi:hypothetical protein